MKLNSESNDLFSKKKNEASPDDDDDQEMDMYEFIRTVNRESKEVKEIVGSSRSSPESQSSFKSNHCKLKSLVDNERKLSEEGPRIMKPALRMKAYKGRRQDTFHSLEAYAVNEDSLTSSDDMTSASEDVLKMPAIEALRVSSPSVTKPGHQKIYHKINSDPSLVANRTKTTSSNSSTRENSGNSKSGCSVKRVLHTVEQPDGSVMGYCTEHPTDETQEK
ncbi:hypothetical protein FO519_000120 [Halicephalobus sp. NKZ332]|nr:hypothetical protein FO519_000120 [Halicephalobus sp. NKZ332]